MIRISIFDDNFPTVLKDMAVTVDPEKFQGTHMTIHGTVNKLDEEVRKQTKELLECWWSHRNRSAAEFYSDEDENSFKQVPLPLMVAFDSNAHKPGHESELQDAKAFEEAFRKAEKSA